MVRIGITLYSLGLLGLPGCRGTPQPAVLDHGVHVDSAADSGGDQSSDRGVPEARADLTPDRPGECTSTQGAIVPAGLSAHFQQWLAKKGFSEDFNRADLTGGSFGGLESDTDCVRREPVIFVHGNGDRALTGTLFGWDASTTYFASQGHRRAELYGTTYGPANPMMIWSYTHSKKYVLHLRHFIEAVLAYTGAKKVDVIAHSMGVTMARKALQGGDAEDDDGKTYSVGAPLTDRVDTFVAIGGGNRGLAACYTTPLVPACGTLTGFYPGQLFLGEVIGISTYLEGLNASSAYEGAHRYAIWSAADEVVGGACLVWARNTCQLPGQTGEKIYLLAPYTHYGMRDLATDVQYSMVVDHVVP